MTPLTAILVPSDLSGSADTAVQRALQVAARHGAAVRLLHVVDPAGLRAPRRWFAPGPALEQRLALARATLDRLAGDLAARHGLSVTATVLAGAPLEQICRAADGADLLVLGSRRHNPLRSLVCGTPAEQLLRVVRQPVLVARQPVLLPSYRRVLVAVALDSDSTPLLQGAGALAPATALHLFHALGTRRLERLRASDVAEVIVREVGDGERLRAAARLRALLGAAGLPNAQATVAHGDPVRLTLQRQQDIGADLVVLGQGGQSALCRFLLGSLPQQLLADAACDVLVMPRPRPRVPHPGFLPQPLSGEG